MSVVVDNRLAKKTASGQLLCIVCNSTVNSDKVWTAHINSRKHIQNVSILKKSKMEMNGERKRVQTTEMEEERAMKRAKMDEQKREIPVDFFDEDGTAEDDEASSSSAAVAFGPSSTPWQKESEMKLQATLPEPPKPNSVDVLPAGFFDDPKLDRKIRNVPDPTEALDEEYLRFQKEMQQVEQQQLEMALEDDEAEVVEREIEDIDNQISQWTRVNELEKKKEDLFSAAPKINAVTANAEDDDDDSDIDLDEVMNWRVKHL